MIKYSDIFYLASSRKIVTINTMALAHMSDNFIDVENPMMMPRIAVEIDCKIILNGKPIA